MTKNEFISKAVIDLLDHNIPIHLRQEKNLDGYSGWFSEDEFVVAMKHPMAFQIFIHEYCHFLQYKENIDAWKNSEDTYDILFQWIDKPKKKFSKKNLRQSLEDIICLEHDCERRVLDIVKEYNIEGFDTELYCQAANAYLFSYHINLELRKRPKKPIYKKSICKHMPHIFNPDASYYLDNNNITPSMRKHILKGYK